MSFQNLPVQLTVLLLGWMFTIYLQHVANRRAEALKRKDKIIDKLDELPGWVEQEISKLTFSASDAENIFNGLLLHIELRMNNFNTHVGRNVIDTSLIVGMSRVDFFDELQLMRAPFVIREVSSNLIEHIELECSALYFSNSYLRRIQGFLSELYGVIVALFALILALAFGKVLVWAFF
ncbi:hypothetical protein [Pseudomonas sp. S9]|uniref:hypothetical protein n=1 Tax=Pseudomonas sp. S9 TaxID=686578 RepID=UPI000255712C|nr:hypothetical protein [Pseudomonas sp. S9]